MIEEFLAWLRVNEPQFARSGIRVEVPWQDPTKAHAVLENDRYLTSITVWEQGAVDVHVLRQEDGEDSFATRYDTSDSNSLISILDDVRVQITSTGL